jgi:hypothetical protein
MSQIPPFFSPITQPTLITNVQVNQGETRTVTWPGFTDSNGNALYLNNDTLRIDVFSTDSVSITPLFDYVSPTNFSITGNLVAIAFQSASLATNGSFRYDLWDDSTGLVLATGTFEILLTNHS